MAQTDPHGWTLAMVSIIVVFGALFILFVIYSAIGKICMAGLSTKKDEEGLAKAKAAAAAIALYLAEEEAASLDCDTAERIITITPERSAWGEAARNFRKYPGR